MSTHARDRDTRHAASRAAGRARSRSRRPRRPPSRSRRGQRRSRCVRAPSRSRAAPRSTATGRSTRRRPRRASSPRPSTRRCTTSGCGICARSATARCTAFPNGRSLRALASAIKEHTLTHLDEYLEQFEANARSNGIHVHWARDAAEHNQIVHGILQRSRRQVADQEQVDADRGVRLPALHGLGRHRGDRNRSRRAHPAARQRRPEPRRRAGGAQAAHRRGRGVRHGRSAPTPTTATSTISRKRSARRRAR